MSEKTRRIALLGLLAALCFGLSYVELMLPALPVGVPGIKAGLANICVVAALYLLGAREAAAVNLIRIALNWLLFGSFTGLLYSLAGGALSFAAMLLLKKSGAFSPIGVSAQHRADMRCRAPHGYARANVLPPRAADLRHRRRSAERAHFCRDTVKAQASGEEALTKLMIIRRSPVFRGARFCAFEGEARAAESGCAL